MKVPATLTPLKVTLAVKSLIHQGVQGVPHGLSLIPKDCTIIRFLQAPGLYDRAVGTDHHLWTAKAQMIHDRAEDDVIEVEPQIMKASYLRVLTGLEENIEREGLKVEETLNQNKTTELENGGGASQINQTSFMNWSTRGCNGKKLNKKIKIAIPTQFNKPQLLVVKPATSHIEIAITQITEPMVDKVNIENTDHGQDHLLKLKPGFLMSSKNIWSLTWWIQQE